MIHCNYELHKDACAIVRQDGLLGTKFLEIMPGNPSTGRLAPGSVLATPFEQQGSLEDLVQKVQHISSNIEQVTESFKSTVGGAQGAQQLQAIFANLAQAAERIASVTEKIDRAFGIKF